MDRTRWVMMPRSDRRTQFDPATTGLDLDHWDPVDECLVDKRSTLSQALHIGSRRGNHLWFTTENGRSFQGRGAFCDRLLAHRDATEPTFVIVRKWPAD